MAQLGPPLPPTAQSSLLPGGATPEVRARASLEDLLPALVKRIAWAGDARRGSVRIELGSGALAGGTVVVHADHGRVRVEITAPAGADPTEWRRRITACLEERGLAVQHVDVT
jgi:hypothetical protein